MLSFLYRLARDFEAAHGEKPNMLYLSRFHFECVRKDFADPDDIGTMMQVLGMTIMITDEAVDPRLARIDRPQPPLATGTGRSPMAARNRRG
jgi:hypothetical protein